MSPGVVLCLGRIGIGRILNRRKRVLAAYFSLERVENPLYMRSNVRAELSSIGEDGYLQPIFHWRELKIPCTCAQMYGRS